MNRQPIGVPVKILITFNLLVFCVALLPFSHLLAWQDNGATRTKTVRRVKRAARPTFSRDGSRDVFFGDVYTEGTVGERPSVDSHLKDDDKLASTKSHGDSQDERWSQIIDAPVIEDEVKKLQQELSQLITTPVIFQTKFNEVNERFEILSMLFAIIRQYDGDIRWAQHAPTAQLLFQKAAVASRTGTKKGFQYCKARKEDLQKLVRGGSVITNDQIPETVDWEMAANRSPIMVWLETANEDLKRLTSNQSQFKSNTERIIRHSNLVAAMAKVIIQDGMPESEEESYVQFSQEMQTASMELRAAVKKNDFGGASSAANSLSRSCSDCHAQWR